MSLDMICILGFDGTFKEVNPAWKSSLGLAKETVINTNFLNYVHPEDLDMAQEMHQLLVSGESVIDSVIRCRDESGMYHFISWTSHPDLSKKNIYCVARDVTERIDLVNKLKAQATTDPLTGAGNRRLFMARSEEELERSQRYKSPLSLLMFDIDHFKKVNDTYGHDVGDLVLRELAIETNNQIRSSDVFCRMGGEEFAVLLINTDRNDAYLLAERIRKALANLTVAAGDKQIHFTVSVGGATLSEDVTKIDTLLKLADDGLYYAKAHGRNMTKMA
ncbi:MAG: diguanylate cyclase [Desulfovibrio sp.]